MSGDGMALAGLITGYLGIFSPLLLLGLLLPAIGIGKVQAHKAEARAQIMGVTAAVKAYYTEYGKYPVPDGAVSGASGDFMYGEAVSNAALFDILCGIDTTKNPRKIVFFDASPAADATHPKSGFATETVGSIRKGALVDPWGHEYRIALDTDYDNKISNLPYTDFQGPNAPRIGVAVFSLGKDGQIGTQGDRTYQSGATRSDDIISWQ
jgi:hypothetical protein